MLAPILVEYHELPNKRVSWKEFSILMIRVKTKTLKKWDYDFVNLSYPLLNNIKINHKLFYFIIQVSAVFEKDKAALFNF